MYLDGLVHAEKLTAQEIVTALPVPLVDPTDVAAPVLSATVLSQPVQTLDSLRAARHGALDTEGIDLSESVELPLMEVRALLDLGDVAKATRKLDDLAERVGWQWRLVWFRAVSRSADRRLRSATKHFTEVLDTFPGELAPKLALAATAELAGKYRRAKFYDTVWSTDNGVISAGFGLARDGRREGDREGAVRTLDGVPATSRHFTTARLTSAVTLLSGRTMNELTEEQIRDAARRVEALPDHRTAGAADPRVGARHRPGLDRRPPGQHQPHSRFSFHAARSAAGCRGVAEGPGPRRAHPRAPVRAGRHGQLGAARSTF